MKTLRNACAWGLQKVRSMLCRKACLLEQALALPKTPELERRLRIFETNYGRDAGWFVERDDRRLALLSDPLSEDMFWESYAIDPLVEDPAERAALLASPELWLSCEFVYRSRLFEDSVVDNAIAAGQPFPKPGRVSMRALYLDIGAPTAEELLLLEWRKASANHP